MPGTVLLHSEGLSKIHLKDRTARNLVGYIPREEAPAYQPEL